MRSQWDDREAGRAGGDALALRVYTSRLLGREPALVLHGGGNTSVKATATTLLGDREEVLYVKGSGWDLAGIEAAGFAPVRLSIAQRLATLRRLTDGEMVMSLRAAMLDPNAPTPSVETILHAIIPFPFVDHTHADAVVAITNTADGAKRLADLYGARVLVVPYVMPGFLLSRKVYEMTRRVDWSALDGIVLMHHGVFTFGADAKASYERMIRLISRAEAYLRRHGALRPPVRTSARTPQAIQRADAASLLRLAQARRAVSRAAGAPMVARWDRGPDALQFSSLPTVRSLATRGPLTPDHVIRTKRVPIVLGAGARIEAGVERYVAAYQAYVRRHARPGLTPLDPAPRWAVWPRQGSVTFGRTVRDAQIAADIARHTMRAIRWAEALGGWRALPARDVFEVEYWELEQAKLTRGASMAALQGKVAVVTGAASGIGRACAEFLRAQGAAVAALDLNPVSETTSPALFGLQCDVTDRAQVQRAVQAVVQQFGGVDILVSNAGTFPPSATIADMRDETWHRSMATNLHSHQLVLQACIPYLTLGVDPAVVIIASKNVPAPGPGASAYSVAKAGVTQLARVAALELAPAGIRVNVIHPDQVFDTAIWTPEVLAQRAARYGLSVEEYKTRNLLRATITSRDVAALACTMVGPAFGRTTGAQVPIDGGNDRVI